MIKTFSFTNPKVILKLEELAITHQASAYISNLILKDLEGNKTDLDKTEVINIIKEYLAINNININSTQNDISNTLLSDSKLDDIMKNMLDLN